MEVRKRQQHGMTGYYSGRLEETEDRHLITEQDVMCLKEVLKNDFLLMVIDDVLCLTE